MALIYNGVEVTKVIYNGTEITKLIYNDTVVWEKPTEQSDTSTQSTTSTSEN